MDLQLANKRALVTGSTVGIGLAIAQALAREGAEVVVNGRTGERVQAACAQICPRNPSTRVHGLMADLGTAAGIATAIKLFPDVDILLNNPGIFEPKAFEEISDADWFRFFEVNVMSGVRLSRHHLPRMKQEDRAELFSFRANRVCRSHPARPSSILKRFERPEEIAEVVAFVASPLSSAMNGTAIRADGGVVRSIG